MSGQVGPVLEDFLTNMTRVLPEVCVSVVTTPRGRGELFPTDVTRVLKLVRVIPSYVQSQQVPVVKSLRAVGTLDGPIR